MDMETLGYFIFMDEQERKATEQKRLQEESCGQQNASQNSSEDGM